MVRRTPEKLNVFYESGVALVADQFERIAEIGGVAQEEASKIGLSVLVEGERAWALGLATARDLLGGLERRVSLAFSEGGGAFLQRLSAATNAAAEFAVQDAAQALTPTATALPTRPPLT